MSETKPLNNKNLQFVILYALGQIFVVAGHCGGGVSLFFDIFPIYQFHVPLFIFISGYFYKSRNDESIKNLVLYIKKKFLSLIIPLYVWNVIYGLFVQVLRGKGMEMGYSLFYKDSILIAPLNDGHQFIFNLCSWFLAPLFFTELINSVYRYVLNFIFKSMKNKELVKDVIVCGTFILLGAFDLFICVHIPYAMTLFWKRQLVFLSFYGIGTMYKNHLEKYDKLPSFLFFVIVIGLQFIITMYQGTMHTYSLATMDGFTMDTGYVRPIIVMCLGILFWLRLSRILVPVIGNSRIVHAIADNGMSILMHQFLGLMAVKTIFALLHKYTPLCGNFEMIRYKMDMWYYYYPREIRLWSLIYIAFGLIIPIAMGISFKFLKNKLMTIVNEHELIS